MRSRYKTLRKSSEKQEFIIKVEQIVGDVGQWFMATLFQSLGVF